MTDNEIKVLVVKYPDRRFLMMRYVDPVTGRHKARSTGTTTRREAERAAAKWEAELREGRYHAPSKLSWLEFRERYEGEKVSGLADNTAAAVTSAFNHLERVIGPEKLLAVNTTTLSRFQAKLRQEGMKDTTLATHLRHLHAGLSWAVSMGMLPKVPDFHMPKRAKGRTLMRGRPITTEEFERILAKVPDVRPKDAAAWDTYLNGLWLSGLRLEESTILSWDEDAPFSVDVSGRRPRFRIYAEAEKGHEDRLLPMTPDFAGFLFKTPQSERTGPVFKLLGLHTGKQLASTTVGRIVSEIGEKAGVVVNKAEGKYASAHDFRRSFGTRWAPKVKPATLQLLMRHKSIETTMKYYVSQDTDDVADELWADYEAPSHRNARRRQQPQKSPKRGNPRR
jgi:integrase